MTRSCGVLLPVAIGLLVLGCGPIGVASSPRPPQPVELTVFAAASLGGALDAARPAFEAVHPGIVLALSTDSSAALRTQIEQGAPADVFLSADSANPEALVATGLADGAAVPFAGNLLAIVVPAGNPARLASPADLARDGVAIVAAGQGVPITAYARRLVDNLARLAGYRPDFAARYAANIVSREDSVKAVVARIELGEGDAAIVYATDAAATSRVATIEVPAVANVPATYAGIVVRASGRRAEGHIFLDWLAGPDGRAILAEAGFLAPP